MKAIRGLGLTGVLRIVVGLVGRLVSVNGSQFGFVPGGGAAGWVFVVRRLRGKCLAANGRLCGFRGPGGEGEHLIWCLGGTWCGGRGGLCDWCGGCVRVRGAVSVLRGVR